MWTVCETDRNREHGGNQHCNQQKFAFVPYIVNETIVSGLRVRYHFVCKFKANATAEIVNDGWQVVRMVNFNVGRFLSVLLKCACRSSGIIGYDESCK